MREWSNLWIFLKHLDLMKHATTGKAYLTPREEDAAELELLLGWMEGSTK